MKEEEEEEKVVVGRGGDGDGDGDDDDGVHPSDVYLCPVDFSHRDTTECLQGPQS